MDRSKTFQQDRRLPTIRDVAARAGVSKSLVSLVLRDSGQVAPSKRLAVLAAAQELGYRTNAAARSLSERRTRTIGVLLNDMRNPWFITLLDGLNSTLSARGLQMLLADGRLSSRAGQDLANTFMELRVDGIVAVGTLPDPSVIPSIASRVPMVVAGARDSGPANVDVVANDDDLGGAMATEHLIGLGHRAIAHLAGPGEVGKLRRASFEATMRKHGLQPSAIVALADQAEEGAYRATIRLLRSPSRPTAIFVFNDIASIGTLSAIEELGYMTPHDVSVIGYDNTYISQLRHIWLTTVDNASYEVGRRAALCLLDRVADPAGAARLILSTPGLQIRGTTGPPPR